MTDEVEPPSRYREAIRPMATYTIKPDHFYLVEGKDLIRLNILCRTLGERIRQQDPSLSQEDLNDAIVIICKALPVRPLEAF